MVNRFCISVALMGGILVLTVLNAQAQKQDTLHFEPLLTNLDNAHSIFAAPGGLLYLAETGQNRLLIVKNTGLRHDSLGNKGFGNYQFDRPLDVDATNGMKIYVADAGNRRIQVYDRRMQYLSTIEKPPESFGLSMFQPNQLATTSTGELLFSDLNGRKLVLYNYRGSFAWDIDIGRYEMAPPADLVFFNGQFAASDTKSGVIHLISTTGRYRRFIGGVPHAKALAAGQRQLWAAGADNKLHRFDQQGRLTGVFSYQLNRKEEITDLAISDHWLFLLTSENLYRCRLD